MKLVVSEINHYWVHFQAGRTESSIIYPRAIVKCYHDVNSKLVYLRYHMYMYPYILDILRNEKPIYFSYSDKSKLGYIRTGKEPVGEGENDADF